MITPKKCNTIIISHLFHLIIIFFLNVRTLTQLDNKVQIVKEQQIIIDSQEDIFHAANILNTAFFIGNADKFKNSSHKSENEVCNFFFNEQLHKKIEKTKIQN